ncbi:ATP-grasp domain-containing protein [Micromonospora sp. CPCC 205561]|uniref:ATP-grasp domain-containing protein n=1 Tax=Micromonospora sp. CPCC 205561 TaxID=3122407 RepID=UPI002FF24D75
MSLPTCLVVYDRGSASAVAVLSAARGVCEVVFLRLRREDAAASELWGIPEDARVVDAVGLSEDDVCELAATLRPDGVAAFNDYRLHLAARIAERCGLPFHSPKTVPALTDKYLQRTLLNAAGVPSPRARLVRGVDDAVAAVADVGLPAVLKPRNGAGSVDTARVDSLGQCRTHIAEFRARGSGDLVLEELLTGDPSVAGEHWGDFVSVESVVRGEDVQTVCVTSKLPLAPPFRETGHVLPCTLSERDQAAAAAVAVAALRALGVRHGVTHTEIKLTPTGPRVIEVNGRLGGYVPVLLRRAAGFDLVRTVLRLAVDEPVTVPALVWKRMEFAYLPAPPVAARTLVSWNDVRPRDLPGIRSIELRSRPGRTLDWRDGTASSIALVHGTATTHDEILASLAELNARWNVVYG